MGLSNRLWEENDACMVRAAGRRASAAGHRRGRRGVVELTAADSFGRRVGSRNWLRRLSSSPLNLFSPPEIPADGDRTTTPAIQT
jgi:hypothetical protein